MTVLILAYKRTNILKSLLLNICVRTLDKYPKIQKSFESLRMGRKREQN